MCYLILSLIQSGHLGHAGSNEDNQRIRDKKTGKDNPAVFGMLVVESKGRMSTIFGNVTLTSKSSYRGSQYDMLSDLRKSNADFMFVSLGCMRFSFLFFFSVKRRFRFYRLISITMGKPDSNWFISHFVINVVSTVSVVILLITVCQGQSRPGH
jgi:hypothetical protein